MSVLTPAPLVSLDPLRARVAGTVSEAGEPGYALATGWNVAVPRHPRAVVEVASPADVVAAVRFAGEHGLRVTVQRTGHGAVPLDADDVLLVHTHRLSDVTVDVAAATATIGAGALWQDVLDAATPHGLAPLAGSAPTVGAIGYLTGGGIGPFVRTYGLSSDHVRAFDVVTGDGQLVRASATEHPELFWGLRGGKATLGVVVGAEIGLVALRSFVGGALFFDGADAPAVMRAWSTWSAALPEHATTSVALLQLPPLPTVPEPLAGRLTISVRYASVAPAAEAHAAFAPMRAVAEPILDGIGELPYAAIAAIHTDPVDPMPVHEGGMLLSELTPEGVERLLALTGPGSGSPQTVVELRRLGGALRRPGAVPSAFCHRDAELNLLTIGVLAGPPAAAVPGHAAQVETAMADWATGGTLPNFAPSTDPEGLARAFDEDTRHWLAALADRHDPRGVLRVGQVVRH